MFSARLFKSLVSSLSTPALVKYSSPFKLLSLKPFHTGISSNTASFIKVLPTLKAVSLPDIKDYLKVEINKTVIDKFSGIHDSSQAQFFYEDLVKQAKQIIIKLDKCQDEEAMKALCTDKTFLNILDEYLGLDIYRQDVQTPLPWVKIQEEISGHLSKNTVPRRPGFGW